MENSGGICLDKFDKIEALKNKGVGWHMKFEINTVVKAINGILYTDKQNAKGRCEKVFVYNSVDECIDAAYNWKIERKQ